MACVNSKSSYNWLNCRAKSMDVRQLKESWKDKQMQDSLFQLWSLGTEQLQKVPFIMMSSE